MQGLSASRRLSLAEASTWTFIPEDGRDATPSNQTNG
jgi:hypothetical protein